MGHVVGPGRQREEVVAVVNLRDALGGAGGLCVGLVGRGLERTEEGESRGQMLQVHGVLVLVVGPHVGRGSLRLVFLVGNF